jgi:coproporphyrinogen III oxidase
MKIYAKSVEAQATKALVENLQHYFVLKLNEVADNFGEGKKFEAVEWLRDNGLHGGGTRYEGRDYKIFDRASVNISQVHYDDNEEKKLSSATAISCIIHPANPHAPSMHMHFSWTQMKDTQGYWRLMADLNPSLKIDEKYKDIFDLMLQDAADEVYYEEGLAQGERYFNIPVLGRTRGVSHFYLENFHRGDFQLDILHVKQFAQKVVDAYMKILSLSLEAHPNYTNNEKLEQIDYHTLYLFQVLTLDRGTTSGLLVHNQNDVGIMGSIPSHVNRHLLKKWIDKMPKPQHKLLENIVHALPEQNPTPVDVETKKKLANVVRNHYETYPEALKMQASGEIIPPTVENHL